MEWLRREQSQEAFDAFVVEWTPLLLRTAYLVCWDLSEAEDLVQEGFLRAAKRWPTIRRMDNPYGYVRRIVINLALRSARRSSGDEESTGLGSKWEHLDERAERELVSVEARDELEELLGELSARQRAVLILRYLDDLSEAEAAAALGWPIGTVKSTAARALDRLARRLAVPHASPSTPPSSPRSKA